MKEKTFYIICFVCVIGSFGFTYFAYDLNKPILLIPSALLLVGVVLFAKHAIKKYAKRAEEEFYYDGRDKVFHVIRRSDKIAKFVKIVDDHNYQINYVPEKVHVGAVTVGGVTTGGTYTTGGYRQIKEGKKTGKCTLEYCGDTQQERIEKIQLTDELYTQAQRSSVGRYLSDDKCLVVINKPNLTGFEEQMLLNTALQGADSISEMATSQHGQEMMKKGYPTYDKCKEIMDWLTLSAT